MAAAHEVAVLAAAAAAAAVVLVAAVTKVAIEADAKLLACYCRSYFCSESEFEFES